MRVIFMSGSPSGGTFAGPERQGKPLAGFVRDLARIRAGSLESFAPQLNSGICGVDLYC
jgi:hypothetical protein